MKISVVKFWILVTVSVLSAAVAAAVFYFTGGTAEFVPPPFEKNAVSGVPIVPGELGYGEIYRDGMEYRFSVCGNVTLNGNEATVFLTNSEENRVWLKLRILDQNGTILGETGILRPGEYVQSVSLSRKLAQGTSVVMKVMGYEPETYHSAGSVSLRTVIGSPQSLPE